jgi:hypothetical protein
MEARGRSRNYIRPGRFGNILVVVNEHSQLAVVVTWGLAVSVRDIFNGQEHCFHIALSESLSDGAHIQLVISLVHQAVSYGIVSQFSVILHLHFL